MEISKDFYASFSGMEGGNIKADIWLCGIESGGKEEDVKNAKTLEVVAKPPFVSDENRVNLNFQFNWRIAKLMTYYLNQESGNDQYLFATEWRKYLRDSLYRPNGKEFKLNLFPLAKPSVRHWPETYQNVIGSQNEYFSANKNFRFPFFRAQRAEHKPKIIIGTGNSRIQDFQDAFGIEGYEWKKIRSIDFDKSLPNSKTGAIWEIDDTVLITTPFFGNPSGLNKNDHLKVLADSMREFANPNS